MNNHTDKREHGRIALVFISYTVLLLPTLSLGLVGAWKVFEKISPIDLNQRASLSGVFLILAGTSVVSVVLIYFTNICWLLVGRYLFSRAEASHLVFYGPTSRFDRWLFNKAFPVDGSFE